jgi:hypothetical protein
MRPWKMLDQPQCCHGGRRQSGQDWRSNGRQDGGRVWPDCNCVFKSATKAGKDGLEHIGANCPGTSESHGNDSEMLNSFDNSRRGMTVEDMLKVFVVEGGAAWALAVKGSFTIAFVLVTEGGKKSELELVSGLALATKAPLERLSDMGPGDIVKDLSRPLFCLHDIFTSLAFHHAYRQPPTMS